MATPTTNDDMDLDPDTSMVSLDSDTAPSTATPSIFTQRDDISTTATSRHPSGELAANNAPQGQAAQGQAAATAAHQQALATAAQAQARVARKARLTARGDQLKDLTVEAQRQLQYQPRHTQLALTRQTRQIFENYGGSGRRQGKEGHGSQARLSYDLHQFLTAKEDVREGGGKGEGGLVFWSFEEGVRARNRAEGIEEEDECGQDGEEGGDEMEVNVEENVEETSKKSGGMHPNRRFRVNAEIEANKADEVVMAQVKGRALWFRDNNNNNDPSRFTSNTSKTTNSTEVSNDHDNSNDPSWSPPFNTNVPKSNPYLSPTTISSTVPHAHLPSDRPPLPSYTHSLSSTLILRSLPFLPADLIFSFPSYTAFPNSAQTYLTHVNRIVKLENSQAQAMLRQLDTKYLSAELNAEGDVRRLEHGYALLRAGVGEMVRDRVGDLFGDEGRDWMGLTGETRQFLKEIYDSREIGTGVASASREKSGLKKESGLSKDGVVHERKEVVDHDDDVIVGYGVGNVVAGRGKLSVIEEHMVARAARVPVAAVRVFWEERDHERRVVRGTRAWVGAREVERGRKAREEGLYYGWENEVSGEGGDGGEQPCGSGDVEWIASPAYKGSQDGGPTKNVKDFM